MFELNKRHLVGGIILGTVYYILNSASQLNFLGAETSPLFIGASLVIAYIIIRDVF